MDKIKLIDAIYFFAKMDDIIYTKLFDIKNSNSLSMEVGSEFARQFNAEEGTYAYHRTWISCHIDKKTYIWVIKFSFSDDFSIGTISNISRYDGQEDITDLIQKFYYQFDKLNEDLTHMCETLLGSIEKTTSLP